MYVHEKDVVYVCIRCGWALLFVRGVWCQATALWPHTHIASLRPRVRLSLVHNPRTCTWTRSSHIELQDTTHNADVATGAQSPLGNPFPLLGDKTPVAHVVPFAQVNYTPKPEHARAWKR